MSSTTVAARVLTDLVLHLVPTVRAVRVHRRGQGRLWGPWLGALRARGLSVDDRHLDDGDARWAPPTDGPSGTVDIYHDPFGPNSADGGTLDVLRSRTAPLVLVDYPHGLTDRALLSALEDRYIEALAEDWYVLEARARAFAAAMACTSTLGAVARGVRFEGPVHAVRTDLSSFRADVPIIQLPLGEAWAVLDPRRTRGTVAVQGPTGAQVHDVRVLGPARTKGPVELGVGVNDHALRLPGVALSEKVRGDIHLGFGDSDLIGGPDVAAHHEDVSLTKDSRMVLCEPRGLDRALVVDDGDWCLLVDDERPVVAAVGGQDGPSVLGTAAVDVAGRRVLGAASAAAHVLGLPDGWGTVSNAEVLASLGDPRLADVLIIPSSTMETRELGVFRTDGSRGRGVADEPLLAECWRGLAESLGPLPWEEVTVLAGPVEWPRAVAFPAVVLVATELEAEPTKLRWLYLVHELVHQWLGGLVRVDEGSRQDVEHVTDAVALTVVRRTNPAVGRVLTDSFERCRASLDEETSRRGRRVLALARQEDGSSSVIETVARVAEESRRSLRTTGRRATCTALVEDLRIEAERC